MPKRPRGNTAWSLRRDLKDYVTCWQEDSILVYVNQQPVVMSRATARLLAKRLNQCLDATVKR